MAVEDLHIPALAGVWQRTLLVQDGARDATSTVYWLQYGDVFGDIRAKAGQTIADIAFLGVLTKHGTTFRWTQYFEHGDLMGGTPDEGRLDLVDDDMFEVGIHSPYLEHWVRVASVGRDDCAIRFDDPETGTKSLLIEIGHFAFCARPNPKGGGAFVLAERTGDTYTLRLAAGCVAKPGEIIDWPRRDRDTLRFATSPLGPAGQTPCTRLLI